LAATLTAHLREHGGPITTAALGEALDVGASTLSRATKLARDRGDVVMARSGPIPLRGSGLPRTRTGLL